MKASEKQELTKKLVTRLEKQFKSAPEPPERTVLDTLLYAVCLENVGFASAERAYEALQTEFHDLNEIRVSSITEILTAFVDQPEPEVRAHRVRTILQFVFEDQYEFDLEGIRKKTQDQAVKKLGQIRDLSPFIRNYAQQAALGAHVIPLDDRQTALVTWLGLIAPETTSEAAAEQLKPAVRKADGPTLCRLLRIFATDSPAAHLFDPQTFEIPEEGFSADDALRRVDEALSGKFRASAKKPAKTKAAKPNAAKTDTTKAVAAKPDAAKPKVAKSKPTKSKADADKDGKPTTPVGKKKAVKSAATKTAASKSTAAEPGAAKKKSTKKATGTQRSPSAKTTKSRGRARS